MIAQRARAHARRLWRGARALGASVRRGRRSGHTAASQLEPELARDLARCAPYTLTSPERLAATSDAVEYAVRRGIPGALVECGVWRGGSVLAMLLALRRLGVHNREVWLYDTFEGMTQPGEHDTSELDRPASETWAAARAAGRTPWDHWFSPQLFGLEQVRTLLLDSGYPAELLRFVAGPVEATIPAQVPEEIAVLRLDTDWYESTRHELVHLYPRLSPEGVLIVDDYGHWQGARKAVDEYLAERRQQLLLHRTDYSGRVGIKPAGPGPGAQA